nr:inorganic phosphate transporter [Micromonospora sp. DSM 115978]
SSHALIGGVLGAALFGAGTGAIEVTGIVAKVVVPALLAPLIAGGVAALGTVIVYALTHSADENLRTRSFRVGQIASASLVSLAHGTNDAQKTMGVITLALVAHGSLGGGADVPFWVIVSCALAIGLGTYSGGWRVIRTLGHSLVEIHPPQGFAAETSTSLVLLVSSHLGLPLSTTQVSSGSIIGSGLGRKTARIDWSVARRMGWAWLLTLPAAGGIGALAWLVADLVGGTAGVIVTGLLVVAGCAWMVVLSRRTPVHAGNVNDKHSEPAGGAETATN